MGIGRLALVISVEGRVSFCRQKHQQQLQQKIRPFPCLRLFLLFSLLLPETSPEAAALWPLLQEEKDFTGEMESANELWLSICINTNDQSLSLFSVTDTQ